MLAAYFIEEEIFSKEMMESAYFNDRVVTFSYTFITLCVLGIIYFKWIIVFEFNLDTIFLLLLIWVNFIALFFIVLHLSQIKNNWDKEYVNIKEDPPKKELIKILIDYRYTVL